MAIFGKKTETVSIPTDQVIKLRQQGLSDEQIVQTLQKDGFKSHQIFEAMNQADVKGIVAPSTIEEVPEPENPMTPPMPPPSPVQSPPEQREEAATEKIEEIAEAIIDEKWNELVVNVNKIIDWKEEVDKKMATIETEMRHLKIQFEKVHSSILGKIEEYDKTMTDVGADVKALTKVFQKALPGFVESASTKESTKGKAPEKQFKPAKKKKSKSEEIFGNEF
ncbi:hypothetical protein KY312_01880 [Candidatus Woesearchaeota archaeon]|nr:hypothetical protein [Candidatus Woesearchaeota archaeon]